MASLPFQSLLMKMFAERTDPEKLLNQRPSPARPDKEGRKSGAKKSRKKSRISGYLYIIR